ncbi:MAG: hypothetical protein DMF97_03845 [Acidobacteria bacterium]|nr:MAG: hypothetical protein DMF97_03845 [Acidobacteriota bacterium]
MTMAARIIGTYSRVSRGRIFGFSASAQKSSFPDLLIARCSRPGPPLYDASARCQSPLNSFERVFRYFAAATVAFSGSDRSSMYQSRRKPFSAAVPAMNCHTPFALTRDSALGLNALSTSGTYARSSGNPSARNTF